MKVLMVGTSFPENAQDWRGRFIYDMAESVARRRDLSLSLWAPPGELPGRLESALEDGDSRFLQKMSAQGGIAHILRQKNLTSVVMLFDLLRRLRRAYRHSRHEVVHVNWLQNAIPLWGTSTPALVTVLGSDYALLDKPGMRAMLRAVFRQRPTVLAPNAAWMLPRLQADFGDVADVEAIPFGVSRSWFEVERSGAECACWIAVTRLTRNKVGNLFAWGEGLFGAQRQLHLFGPMQEQLELPPWVVWHGPTHPDELRNDWFPRATGLITLSMHDEGRPQVMLEAMAAGLPVIASDLPAHLDLIRHRDTGWLVQERSQLVEALNHLEDVSANRRIGAAARRCIKETIGDWDDCAARYAALYQRLAAR
ncbi:MAG: glycosyltransferase family 4 protein [Nitrosomonadales bacterium]|nr:glycosyltransferase family 4 protein [Nitrosomonadales bacterium]